MQFDDYTGQDHTDVDRTRGASAAGYSLYVLSDDRVESHPLPSSGQVHLGRAPESCVVIDRTEVSRRHATLTVGRSMTLVDNSSANGTLVRGEALAPGEPTTIEPGDVIEIGGVMLVVRQRYEVASEPLVCEHDYFELRVGEQCERSSRTGESFAVLRARIDDRLHTHEFEHAVQRANPDALIGRYGPLDYEVMVIGDERAAIELMRSVSKSCSFGAPLDWGVGRYSKDGLDAHQLIARANRAVAGSSSSPNHPIVVASSAMKNVYRLAQQVAKSDINVLLLGETGVGKEVLAQRIHEASPRAAQPLVRLCCASLSPALMESELFGHVKGAFTGAIADRAGLLETGSGGTVFLDEIGELELELQAKLLRVLEDRVVRRVGSSQGRAIDVRFVAATNRDLEARVAAGMFRRDLFYRLNGFSIVIPPLRDRVDEIGDLARVLIRQAGGAGELTLEAQEFLEQQSWPGNVRELRNALERAVILAQGGDIGPEHLRGGRPRKWSRPRTGSGTNEVLDLREAVEATERRLIEKALARADGNQTNAARILGISRQKLVARMDAYGLARPRKSRDK